MYSFFPYEIYIFIYFQDDFIKLEGIHTLDLSKNHLTKLPENFGQLKSLKQLDLFDNRITNLPLSFGELTKLEVNSHFHLNNFLISLVLFQYLDLKNNPLDDDLQNQAGKCLNKKECRLCAGKVLHYFQLRKEDYEKEEAMKLKKKQANAKAKAKKREKQAEKEREEKRLQRIENAQKRSTKKEQEEKETNENTDKNNEKIVIQNQDEDQEEGLSKNRN